jgi:hypothetical protein
VIKVENLPYNSLNLNLQLTAVLSKLASFPQVLNAMKNNSEVSS